jgi:hypothetical protein
MFLIKEVLVYLLLIACASCLLDNENRTTAPKQNVPAESQFRAEFVRVLFVIVAVCVCSAGCVLVAVVASSVSRCNISLRRYKPVLATRLCNIML